MTILQVAITTFITALLAVGVWVLIAGSIRERRETQKAPKRLPGRVIWRDIVQCYNSDEYYTVEIRKVSDTDFRFVVLHDGFALMEVSSEVVKSWVKLFESLKGVDTIG